MKSGWTSWCVLVVFGLSSAFLMSAGSVPSTTGQEPAAGDARERSQRNIALASDELQVAPVANGLLPGSAGIFVGVNRFSVDEGVDGIQFAVHDAIELAYLFVFELNLLPAKNCVVLISDTTNDPLNPLVARHLESLKNAGATIKPASRAQVLYSLGKVQKAAQQPAELLIASFSTHGYCQGRRAFVMPEDGVRDQLDETAISVEKIELEIEESKASHRLIFVDACQERIAAKGSTPAAAKAMEEDFLKELKKHQGQIVLASCSPGESSYENANLGGVGHGVFSHMLLEALRGGAEADAMGFIRLDAVASYVSTGVKDWSRKANRPLQSPFFAGPEEPRRLPLAIRHSRLSSVIDDVAKRNPEPPMTLDLRTQWVDLLKSLEASRPEDQEVLTKTRDFLTDKMTVSAFVPYVRAELERRNKRPVPAANVPIVNSIGMKLARIPKGRFLMGSPEGEEGSGDDELLHEVELTRDFYMGVYEVTQGEYSLVMGKNKNPSRFSTEGEGKADVAGLDTSRFPVEQVSREDAEAFCAALSELEGEKTAGRRYRLPTEAEWEYACRAGAKTPFHWGSSLNGDRANCDGDSPYGTAVKGLYLERTTQVGTYAPNAWGLYDMHGNVSEWCSDWYQRTYYRKSPKQDPPGPGKQPLGVTRGGSWDSLAHDCRAAARNFEGTLATSDQNGFRVVAVLEGPEQ